MGIDGIRSGTRSYGSYGSSSTRGDFASYLQRQQEASGTAPSSGGTETSFEPGTRGPHKPPPFMQAAARSLGYDDSEAGAEQMMKDLRESGQNLTDFANSKVSGGAAAVQSAVTAELQTNMGEGTDVSGMVSNIMSRTPGEGPGGPGGHRGPPPFIDAAATALGYDDTDAFMSDLKDSGLSLSDFAKQKGVEPSTVEAAITTQLQENPPPGGTGDVSSLVNDIMTRTGPPTPPGSGTDDASLEAFRASDLQKLSISAQ